MAGEYRLVYPGQGLLRGDHHAVRGEVSLQPRADGEAARGGVHAGHVLTVVDVLQCQFVPGVKEVIETARISGIYIYI